MVNDRLLILALVALNLAVKLGWSGAPVLVHDEPFTVYWSQRPWPELWQMLRGENNPPLHFLITRAWSLLVPFEPACLRAPSAFFSALTAWPLYRIAHRFAGTRTALLSVLVFTLSNYHIGFAHEVRAYALFTFLSVSSMWLLVRQTDHGPRRSSGMPWLLLVLVAMVYTHFLGWLMIGVLVLSTFALPALSSVRRKLIAAALIAAALFAPYALMISAQASKTIAEGTWLPSPSWEEPYNMIWRWSNAPVIAFAFIGLIVIALVRARNPHSLQRLGLAWCIVPLIALFGISFIVPVFHDRYLVFIAPGFALLVGYSLFAVGSRPFVSNAIAAGAVVGMALTCRPEAIGRYHPEQTVARVKEWCGGDCHVEVVPNWYWLNYLAAADIASLRADQQALLRSSPFVPDTAQAKALGTYILIDASATAEFAMLKRQIGAAFPIIDSIQTDHRVWLHAYRASP